MGPGFGPHHRHHHHGLGLGPAGLVAGAVAGAAVASAVARPRRSWDRYDVAYGAGPGGYSTISYGQQTAPMAVVAGPPLQYEITPVPELGVASVRLPSELIEDRFGITYFSIEVTPSDGRPVWRVLKRYNDFDRLADLLGGQARTIMSTPFPRKHLTGCQGHKLEARRLALQSWLETVVRYSQNYDYARWRMPLRTFLEVPIAAPPTGGLINRATGAPGAPPALSSQAPVPAPVPPPSAPGPGGAGGATSPTALQGYSSVLEGAPQISPEAPTATADPTSGQGMAMEVEVPPGVQAGQFLGVTVPSGEQLLVQLPEGCKEGQTLHLWWEGSTLQVLQ